MMKRRDMLQYGLLGMAASAIPASRAFGSGKSKPSSSSSTPKNIIMLVSDGMSMGVPTMAEQFSHIARESDTIFQTMMRSPEVVRGFFDMSSLNSTVTDSAAASSSWGSGSRVFNRAINFLPDGTALSSIGEVVKNHGKALGLVTTATVTHATPAGFVSSSPTRYDQPGIATQYLNRAEVILGGGIEFFDPGMRGDKRDLIAEYGKAGYTTLQNRRELLGAKNSGKLLGLFSKGHIPYALDRINDKALAASTPTLAEMSRKALNILSKSENGFLLQIEGARIDHAAHANDSAAILWEQLEFDDAVRVAIDFARERGDTLIIVTTDHGNSNPGLNGMGDSYKFSAACFEKITKISHSFERLEQVLSKKTASVKEGEPKAPLHPEDLMEAVRDLRGGLALKPKQVDGLVKAWAGKGHDWSFQKKSFSGVLGEVEGNTTGVGWCGSTHTSDWVPVLSYGPGAERFAGLVPNVSFFPNVMEMWGINFRNPSLTPEQAAKFQKEPPVEKHPHWLNLV